MNKHTEATALMSHGIISRSVTDSDEMTERARAYGLIAICLDCANTMSVPLAGEDEHAREAERIEFREMLRQVEPDFLTCHPDADTIIY